MSRKIHVLQIIDSMAFGGAEVLLRDLSSGLLAHDMQVSVCYNTSGPIAQQIEAAGIPVTRLPRFARVDPYLLWQTYRQIKKLKPDIVHTHLFKSDFHGRLAARMAGVPVVISTLHNCHNWAKNPVLGGIYGANARLADHVIAVSDEVRDYAVEHIHVDPKKLSTIANAVPLSRFGRDAAARNSVRAEFGISSGAPLVGIIARLTEQKDHDNFLHAAKIILRDQPEAKFLVVGEGPLAESLKALSLSLGIDRSVMFCGNRSDIPAVMSALDVLVFSSRWEGLPVALLEGMASSLPVVSTRVGGVPGVIQNGETGVLVPPADSQSLADACLLLIKDPALREKMGQAGNIHVRANYGMDGMVEKIANLYRSLLGAKA